MKITITEKVEKEVDLRFLRIQANVRYWEDATVNGVEDENGDLIPFRCGDIWNPIIDINKGTVIDWPEDVEANIHYKVCDAGSYQLSDGAGNVCLKIDEYYVPRIACPEGGGYGDYIIMNIDGSGKIANWPENPDISCFLDDE